VLLLLLMIKLLLEGVVLDMPLALAGSNANSKAENSWGSW